MADEINFVGDMQRLVLQPGDVIVITTDRRLDPDACKRITDGLAKVFPDNKSVILGDGMKLGVMEPA